MSRHLLTVTVEHHANREIHRDEYGQPEVELPAIKVPLIRLVKATKDVDLRDAMDAVNADPVLSGARGIISLRLLCDDAEMGRALVFVWNQMQDPHRAVDMTVEAIETFRGGFVV